MALGQLIDGKWTSEWTERDEQGQFRRMPTQFHHWITADGSSGFKAESGRYHLYISLGCPWANRTAILWKLKGLETTIGLSIVDPVISEFGWKFTTEKTGCIPDPLYNNQYLWELYVRANSTYTGRVTVPVLWDRQTQTIVNNESRQIIQMLNNEFNEFAQFPERDFYPIALRPEIDHIMDAIYTPINNGVYRSGFASSQTAYETAVTELFAALEHWESVLEKQRYLCGDQITLADWCLFPTLFRFDLAYYGLFKCNLKRLIDYPNLWGYLCDLYQQPGVATVCSLDHVKQIYYGGLKELNPSGILPKGPLLDLNQNHDRARLVLST